MTEKATPSSSSSPIETPGFFGSTFQGEQSFSLEQSEHQLKAEDAAHKRAMELAEHQLTLDERRKDNDARRGLEQKRATSQLKRDEIIFWLIVVAIGVGFVAGCVGAFNAPDAEGRRTWLSLVTLIVGGLVGYITGRKTSE